jgi:tetratricopeptide (TPR) repeat protein
MTTDFQPLVERKQRLFDRKTIFFLVVAIVMFVPLVLLITLRSSLSKDTSAVAYWTAEKQFQYANTLASKGLKREALNAYEKYMDLISASPADRAKVAYQMGTIHMDLGEYEKALASFYRVDMENPDTELAPEVGQKIVACLERLGMTSQARYELESRTAIGKKKPDDAERGLGPVIARIGKEEVRMSAINEALDQLPAWMRKQYESDEGKVDFARQYIANELLYRKANRLGYGDDPDVRVKVRDLTKQVLVQKITMEEIGKIIIDPRDVKLYYDAYKDKYAEKAKFKLSMIQVSTREKAEDILRQIRSGKSFADLARAESLHEPTKSNGGEIKKWVIRGGYIADNIGNSPQAWEAIGKTSQGATDIVEVNQQFYIFWVHERTPERQREFSEVKEQVEADYRRERQEQAAQDLLDRTLEEQEVEIYADKLLK